jgi:hypothetical protein
MTTRDGAALAGLLLLAVGCWWIYPPAALIVTGFSPSHRFRLGARE